MGHPLQQAPRRLTTLVVGLVVHAWAGTASAAPAAEPEPIEARLEIDTGAAGESAEVLHRRIEERANIVLRQAKVLPGDADDVSLVVSVRELAGDEPGYAVTFELRAADGSPLDEPQQVDCRLCTETELVARVEAELAPVLERLRELEAEQPEVTPTLPQPEPEPAPAPISPSNPAPPERKGMLAGGIALLVVGSGALGAGVGLAIPEPKIDEDNPLDLITTRPVGYGLLAGGIAAAATGAVLTAIAVKQRREARWSMTPFGGRGGVGVVFVWRFG